MNKLEIITEDKTHEHRTSPKWKKFDNNYLYYLYCRWSVTWDYDDARVYLWDNISQIVDTAKSKWLYIKREEYYDITTQMYMIVDDLYRRIFEDEKPVTIRSLDWVESRWTRFEKYYQPKQVYWYLKLVVNKRICSFFSDKYKEKSMERNERIDESESNEPAWQDWMKEINKKVSREWLISKVLSKLINTNTVEEFVFISVHLHWNTYEEISRILKSKWIDYSVYKVKKAAAKVLDEIRESMWEEDIDLLDYI